MYLSSALWRYAEGERHFVVLYMGMSITAMVLWMLMPLVMAEVMNRIQRLQGDELLTQTGLLLLLSVGLSVVAWMFHGPSRVIETNVAFSVRRTFLTRLLARVLELPVKWHQRNHSGKTIDNINRAGTALAEFCEAGFDVLGQMVRCLVSMVVLVWFMPAAGIAIAAATILVVVAIVTFDRRLVKKYETTNTRLSELAAVIQDFLTNVMTVISLRLERRVVREVSERAERIRPLVREAIILSETKWFTSTLIVDGSRSAVLFGYLVLTVRQGSAIEIGTLFALAEYLRTLGEAFFQFSWRYGDMLVKATRLQSVEHIDRAFESEVGEKASASLPAGWKRLRIEGLEFRHEGQERPVINGVSVLLERGRTYAFVGESGSGKSTLLSLIRGLHQANEGEVFADGREIAHGLRAIAHHTTLIPQDPEIFEESIRFNVTLGVKASDEQIMRTLTMSRFASVLARLSRGLDTSVAEKGVTLSGGERQRLALARGLFFAADSDSEIVLLDESTSSVDLVNERAIYSAVLGALREKVVISAIHKFNLLHLFDEILVVEGGCIVERGTVESLVARDGPFHRMWARYSEDSKIVRVASQ